MIFVTAHQAAFDRAGILHRDISVDNLMFEKDSQDVSTGFRSGLLIDFDYAHILRKRRRVVFGQRTVRIISLA